MMKFAFALILLYTTYHTWIYAVRVWKKENNKFGSIAVMIMAILVLVLPMFFHQLQVLFKELLTKL